MNENQQKSTEAEAEKKEKAQENGQPAGAAQNGSAQPAPADGQAAGVAAPQARVAELEAEVANLKDQVLRALAEVENIRRRAQREREDTAKYAVSNFAKELLAVSDNLRRALEAVPAEGREGNDMINTLAVGVEATERQLAAAFEKAGIQKMDPMGEAFDPNFHQVMFEVENTGKPAGTVVQVLQHGYTIHGRLLREALVGVAKGGAAAKVDTSA